MDDLAATFKSSMTPSLLSKIWLLDSQTLFRHRHYCRPFDRIASHD